jgi:membrane-bound lytic murein transglycosylase MltF
MKKIKRMLFQLYAEQLDFWLILCPILYGEDHLPARGRSSSQFAFCLLKTAGAGKN